MGISARLPDSRLAIVRFRATSPAIHSPSGQPTPRQIQAAGVTSAKSVHNSIYGSPFYSSVLGKNSARDLAISAVAAINCVKRAYQILWAARHSSHLALPAIASAKTERNGGIECERAAIRYVYAPAMRRIVATPAQGGRKTAQRPR